MLRKHGFILRVSFISLISGLLISCIITPKLFEDIKYTEYVSSILVSQDGEKFVVIGRDYHYIFEAPKAIINTINSPFHELVRSDLSSFYIDNKGVILGEFKLTLPSEITNKQIKEAQLLGYKLFSKGNTTEYRVFGELQGVRYRAGDVKIPNNDQLLNREYKIDLIEQQKGSTKAIKSLLTPITVTADTVILLGLIPLAVATSLISVSTQ